MIASRRPVEFAHALHPLSWGIIAVVELLSVARNPVAMSSLLLLNVAALMYFSWPSAYNSYVRNIVFSFCWGLGVLTLIRCRFPLLLTSWDCLAGVFRFLSGVLFCVSLVNVVATGVAPDRLFTWLLSQGVPLWLYHPTLRAVALVDEISTTGRDAFALHELSGRPVRLRRQRFLLLADILRAAALRALTENTEGYLGIRTRLRQTSNRPQFLLVNSLKWTDAVFVGGAVFLVTGLALI